LANKVPRWVIGCGVGCGLVLLFVVVIGILATVGSVSFFKKTFGGIAVAEASYQELIELAGSIEDYAPPPDGSVTPQRMELFLSVREALGPKQDELTAMFADFPPDEVLDEKVSAGDVFKIIGDLAGMVQPISEYVDLRHRALIEREMGIGEYLYIYSIAYHSWLGHSPEEGPVVTKETGGQVIGDPGDQLFDGEDSTYGPRKVRRRYRRYMLAMVQNQRDALPDGAEREMLDRELRLFESNPGRVLWQDGVPLAIEASLTPFRARLDATYRRDTNLFEFPARDEGRWRVTID